jgi:Fe-S-cluster containining protein
MIKSGAVFKCIKCGVCCSNLIYSDKGVFRGLTLLPNEKKIFPKYLINPAIGIGKNPREKEFKIIAYQFTKNTCIHLKNNICVRYESRPSSCIQFPFSIHKGVEEYLIGIDLNCPSMKEMIQKDQKLIISDKEKKAAELLMNLQLKVLQSKEIIWFKDVKTGIWIKMCKLDK